MSYLALLLFALLMFVVLMWGFYELLRLISGGRRRPSTIVALMAVSLVFLFLLAVAGDINYWWAIPDAVSCADNAELIMGATPGPAAGGLGDVHQWEFYNCSAFWYA